MKKTNMFSGLQDFFILWGSQFVLSLGTAMTNFALIIWVYNQKGTASSITLLTICSFLPTILFRFVAGTIADRWDKKRIMLLADLMAACGTVTVLALYSFSVLQVWHLYIINFLLSFITWLTSFTNLLADGNTDFFLYLSKRYTMCRCLFCIANISTHENVVSHVCFLTYGVKATALTFQK